MKKKKTAHQIQDEIFQKMSVSKKLRLTSELSGLLLKLNKLNKNGTRRIT